MLIKHTSAIAFFNYIFIIMLNANGYSHLSGSRNAGKDVEIGGMDKAPLGLTAACLFDSSLTSWMMPFLSDI